MSRGCHDPGKNRRAVEARWARVRAAAARAIVAPAGGPERDVEVLLRRQRRDAWIRDWELRAYRALGIV